jgi:hypothetical protein
MKDTSIEWADDTFNPWPEDPRVRDCPDGRAVKSGNRKIEPK